MVESPRSSRPRLRRTLLAAIGALLALVLVVFAPQWSSRHGADARVVSTPVTAAAAQSPNAEPAAIAVRVLEVRASAAPTTKVEFRATGTLQPRRHAPLAFAVDGVVLDVPADEGDEVDAGEILARLDATPFESAVAQARARVDYLQKSLDRSRTLREQKALSDEEYDAQQAELDGARAQLRLAQWRLERSVLRAPFAGSVLERHVETGQVVGAGAPAYELIESRTLEVDAALPAQDLAEVDLGAAVTVTGRDDARVTTRGSVDHAPVRSDTRSGTVPIRVVVPNAAGVMLPGMVVEVAFAARADVASGSRLSIPLSALRLDDTGRSVWKVEDGRAVRVPVELGPVRGDHVVVRSGLREGDLVIDEAPDRLQDGDAVAAVVEETR